MTSLVPRTVIVDGVRLDTFAAVVTSRTGWDATPGKTGENIRVPGSDGTTWQAKDYDTSRMVLDILVTGSQADGTVPEGSTADALLRQNIDRLFAVFGRRHGLIQIDKEIEDGTVRRNFGEVTAVIEPAYPSLDAVATFTVEITFPDPLWKSTTSTTATGSGTGTIALSALAGITAPISDAVITISGAGTNPRITDTVSGAWIQYTGSFSGTWSINCANFTSTINGASVIAGTTFAPGPRFLPITPNGSLIPSLSLSGFSSASVSVSAFRRFLA